MPSNKFEKNFTGGRQELDRDDKLVQQNAYRYALNAEVARSEASDVGALQSTRGNRAIATDLNISPTSVTVGFGVDTINDRIYWFNVSATTEGIFELDLETNTVSRIIEVSRSRRIFNFSPDFYITGVDVIGNSIYWTDDNSEPRKINIERFRGTAIDPEQDANGVSIVDLSTNIITRTGDVVISSVFASDIISLAKRPPLFPPIILNQHSDNPYGAPGTPLYESFASFATRYIFRDGETSSISPFSQPAFFPEDFAVTRESGVLTSMVNRYRNVELKFDVGNNEVTEVEVLAKRAGDTNIYSLGTINKSENNITSSTPYLRSFSTYTYDNSQVYRVLPSDQLTRIADVVPIKAKAQAFVGNRLVFGNYVQNYPLTVNNENGSPVVVDFDVSVNTMFKNEDSLAPSRSVKSDREYEVGIVYLDRNGRQTPVLIPGVTGVNRNNVAIVPFADSGKRNRLNVNIHSEAPYWATHYRFFIKNTKATFYNIFPTNIIDSMAGDVAYLQIPSLESHQSRDERSGVISTINKVREDDIITLKSYSKDNVNDVEIERREYRVTAVGYIDADTNNDISTDGTYITVAPVVDGDLATLTGLTADQKLTTVFETVPEDTALDAYWEFGATYRCNNGLHTGATEDLVRTDQPQQEFNNDGTTTSISLLLNWFNCFSYSNGVESMTVRDEFFGNQIELGVRGSTVQDDYRPRRQQTHLIHSGIYNDNINLNRLNEFNPGIANTMELEIAEGSIQKLHQRNTNLTVFQEDKVKLVPIDKELVTTADGQESFSVSSDFFNIERPYVGNYGISRAPESFSTYGEELYWADPNRGCILRLDQGGIDEISKYGTESLFRTDTRQAQQILGGYDEYHKRNFISLKNRSIPSDTVNTLQLSISTSGCPDPRAECSRDTNTITFRDVYLNIEAQDGQVDVGDVVFVDTARSNHFDGNFRWFRLREGAPGARTFERVIQISPDGIITSVVDSCSMSYPDQIRHVVFNISSECFTDEYDACANGVVDSIAYLGCPLDESGAPTNCGLTSTSEPDAGFIIYEGRSDLIPSSRTGWFLISEDAGLSVIEVDSGRVIRKIDCDEISRGRRAINGSVGIAVLANDTAADQLFDRNLRICSADNGATTYYFRGDKERPDMGDALYTNNINDILATGNRYYAFADGYFVRLDSDSNVDLTGSCFTMQCTNDVEDIFTKSTTVANQFTFDGLVGTGDVRLPIRGATISWVVLGVNRYPASGSYTFEMNEITVGSTFTLNLPAGVTIPEANTDVTYEITQVCYRDSNVSAGVESLFRTTTGIANVDTATIIAGVCNSNVTAAIYYNQSSDTYHTTSVTSDANRFDGGDEWYGIGDTANMPAQRLVRISSNGVPTGTDTVHCDFRFPFDLAYDATGAQNACAASTTRYYGDMEDFSSAGPMPTTQLVQADGQRTPAIDGVYSDRIVTRQISNGVLGDNGAQGCSAFVRTSFTADFGDTAREACENGNARTLFSNNDTLNAQTTGLYLDAAFVGVAATGYYSVSDTHAYWDGTTLTFLNACPVTPTFTFATAGVSCSVNNAGQITTSANLGTVSTVMPSSFAQVTEDTEREINITVTIPSGFANTGTVSGVCRTTQPGIDFAYTDADVTCSVDVNGAVTVSAVISGTTTTVAVDSFSPNSLDQVTNDQSRTIDVTLIVPSGYENSGEMVNGQCTATQPGTSSQPAPARAFTFADAGATASIDANGAITVTPTTGTFVSSNPASYARVRAATDRTFQATIRVPNDSSLWTNANMTVSGDLMAQQPRNTLPDYTFSQAGASAAVDENGVVSAAVSGAGASVSSFSPSSFGTVSTPTQRTIRVVVNVPNQPSTYFNVGSTVSGDVNAEQSPLLPVFGFADAGVTCSVASDGTITVGSNLGTATNTPAQNFPALNAGDANVERSVNVRVVVNVSSSYRNSGSRTFNGTCSATQTAPALPTYSFSDASVSGSIDRQTGNVSITVGDSNASLSSSSPSSFDTVTTATDRTVNVVVDVPSSGYTNSGGTVSDDITISQQPIRTISASESSLSWTYAEATGNTTRTVTITTAPTAGEWEIASTSSAWSTNISGNTITVDASPTSISGHTGTLVVRHTQDSSVTATINLSIAAQLVQYGISADTMAIEFDADGDLVGGSSSSITVTTTPTAGRFGFRVSDSWINATRDASSNVINVSVPRLTGVAPARNGNITITHLDDSAVSTVIRIRQIGVI